MSTDALQRTTLALQRVLHNAVGPRDAAGNLTNTPNESINVGAPQSRSGGGGGGAAGGARPVSLMLFHIEPNREMRGAPRLVTPPGGGPEEPLEQDALALDLRYLISVNRNPAGPEPNELFRMGQVLAAIQAMPVLTGALLPDQEVRITLEPYSMEELSRIWGLFPDSPYTTSVVCLAAPVFVDARQRASGEPIVSRRLDSGHSAERPDVFGRRREEPVP